MTPNTEQAYCDEIKRLKAKLDEAEQLHDHAAIACLRLQQENREAKQVIKYLAAQMEVGL